MEDEPALSVDVPVRTTLSSRVADTRGSFVQVTVESGRHDTGTRPVGLRDPGQKKKTFTPFAVGVLQYL